MDALTFQREALKIEKLLYHVAYVSLGGAQDCADAVQEALLRAWKARRSLRREEAFKAWMVRILVNTVRDQQRKRRPETAPLDETLIAPACDNLPLHEALGKLPQDMRCAVTLVYLHGCTTREAGDMLGIPEGTIKSRLSRARELLRDYLSEEDEGL